MRATSVSSSNEASPARAALNASGRKTGTPSMTAIGAEVMNTGVKSAG